MVADRTDHALPGAETAAIRADTGSEILTPEAPEARDTTPSVLAVIVAHAPGDWFDETLESFATQDYQRLEVMVVDAAGDPSLASRVQSHLPEASVLDASDTDGFSAAANALLDTHVDPVFLMICHDDIALEPDAVRLLVVESLRSNAGIVGPKLVDWDNPDRLQHVAYIVDRLAVAADVVEPGEIDQEQYDAVVDVFAVPSACILIRTDLFRDLDGFDPGMPYHGEDVDLCFRAQLAGARVMAVPDARVRHRQALSTRTGVDDDDLLHTRHQLRTVMVTSSYPSLCYLLPFAFLFSFSESMAALFARRFSQFRDIWGAWLWNLSRLGEIHSRRQAVRHIRRTRHKDVRTLQQGGSVRLNVLLRGRIGTDSAHAVGQELASVMRTGTARISAVVCGLVGLFVVFGSRSLIADGIPAIGDYLSFGGSGSEMIGDWWSGWRERDMGSTGAASSSAGLLGLLSILLGGATGLVRTLWVLLPVVVGLVGAWRMLRPTGSRRAQLGCLFVYAVIPLPWAAVANASISGIYAYGLAPWLLAAMLSAQSAWSANPDDDSQRSVGRVGWKIGAAVGVTALFDLSAALIVVPMIAGLFLAAVLTVNFKGILRLFGGVIVALPMVALLVLPFLADLFVAGPSWDPLAGGRDGSASAISLVDILSFDIGPREPGVFVWAFGLLMVIGVVIGRSWRFGLAVRGWSVAIVSWGLTWVAALGWLPFGVPDNSVLLATAAAGVALTCGVAIVAFEHDLPTAGFGWCQALLPVAVLAAVAGSIPGLALAETGRWEMPRGDYEDVLPFADPLRHGSYRVLWIGVPETILGDGRPLVADLAWVGSIDGPPNLSDRLPAVDAGSASLVNEALSRAINGDTIRLGRELGGLGIRYVVLLDRLAPAPFSDPDDAVPIPEGFRASIASQLDLQRLEGINSAVEVYANTDWTSVRAAATPGFDSEVARISDLSTVPISGTAGVMSGRGDQVSGSIPDGTEVFVAQTSDNSWTLEVDGSRAAQRRSIGYATAFVPQAGGTGELTYFTAPWRRWVLIVQVSAILFLIGVVAIRPVIGHRR
ncbi:MAG: glycosyltransferase family 2 protein [Acidimicrobiaceae bacterium]|nr:glycosyltransferase family 2 protein [Acidimicrobiaceae bacterium]MYD08029.1 glycosyltransferase family 2 protein [Acidimicrobiaceae bacterium]MYI58491.1 glycosyltransferase family 2 protein [Acidimicrobiaceae bacterium]